MTIQDWPPGKAFEYLVVRAFDLEDGTVVRWPYTVTYPQKLGIVEQVDGLVRLNERSFMLESKHHDDPTAIEPIAKLRFRLEGRPPGTMGVVFSVSDFSLPAETFAQFASPLNVLLWNRTDLDKALPSGTMVESLQQKFQYAVEHGLPLFPLVGGKA